MIALADTRAGPCTVGETLQPTAQMKKGRVMNDLSKQILLAGCAAAALASSSEAVAQVASEATESALAQMRAPSASSTPVAVSDNAAASNSVGIDEIVVTANKREENLNKVGLTVTAISGDALAERRITSLQDVASAVPGLAFAPSANNTPILTLRGIGFNESSLGVYPAVSVYIDQAPLPFPVLASHSAYDLQRIEVLKGPQGTLFGQNSTGGAINYIAAKPGSEFSGGGDISYGRFNQIEGNAFVTGALTDTLRARLAVTGASADGWQISTTRPQDRNGKQSYVAGRLLLDWDASDTIRLSLNLNGWNDKSEPQAAQWILLQPQTPATVRPEELAQPFTSERPRAADWSVGEVTPRSARKFYQAALRADIDLSDDITLTSLISYDHYTQNQTTDGDGSALIVTDLQADDGYIHSFNQELRLANAASSSLRWVVGANLEKSKTAEDQLLVYFNDSNNSPALNNIFQSITLNRQSIRNYAFFGNAEFDVTPELTLKGAIRYTNSRNRATICGNDAGDGHIAGLFNLLGSLLGTVPFTPVGSSGPSNGRCYALNENNVPDGTPFVGTLRENNVSWRAGLDYRATPGTLLYVNVSRGYKAGSFPVLAAATIAQYTPVTQESVTAYEGGIKAGFLDRRVQINAAAFYYQYKDKQVLTKIVDPVFGILDALRNVPKSSVFGVEGEVTVRPVHGLTIGAAVTYLNAKIKRYQGFDYIGTSRDFAGEALPFTPKWNYGLNVDYRFDRPAGGTPFIGVSVNGRSRSDTVPGGRGIAVESAPTTRSIPGLVHPFVTNAYATVDARLGFEAPGGRWKVMLWGKNIFNEYYWTNVVTASDNSARYAGRPATYGITLGFKLD